MLVYLLTKVQKALVHFRAPRRGYRFRGYRVPRDYFRSVEESMKENLIRNLSREAERHKIAYWKSVDDCDVNRLDSLICWLDLQLLNRSRIETLQAKWLQEAKTLIYYVLPYNTEEGAKLSGKAQSNKNAAEDKIAQIESVFETATLKRDQEEFKLKVNQPTAEWQRKSIWVGQKQKYLSAREIAIRDGVSVKAWWRLANEEGTEENTLLKNVAKAHKQREASS